MKRLHVHLSVKDLDGSIEFYSNIFGARPQVKKDDYARWMLDDPRLNFAISARGRRTGLDHLGIQVESADDLKDLSRRFADSELTVVEQENVSCCYAQSDKAWVVDPQGIPWESFFSRGESTVYGEDFGLVELTNQGKCCSSEDC